MQNHSISAVYKRIAMSSVDWRERHPHHVSPAIAPPRTLHEAVLEDDADLHALEEVKTFAKGHYLLDKNASDEERKAYFAIYISAIASALRWHAISITHLPIVPLVSALLWVTRQDWLPAAIRQLCNPRQLLDALEVKVQHTMRPN